MVSNIKQFCAGEPCTNRMRIPRKVYAVCICLGLFIAPTILVAATRTTLSNVELTGDFVLGPGKTEIIVEPGESVVKNITVTNRVDRDVTFSLTIEDIRGSEDPSETVVLLGSERGPYSLRNFVIPELTEFTLAPREQISIPVTVSIPADASPGGHYGAVVVSNAPSVEGGAEERAGAQIISRIGSVFLVRVAGDAEEAGELTDFRLSGPARSFYQGGPFTFEILFRNSGSVHLTPYGTVTIEDTFGQIVDVLPVNAYFSLPQSLRARQIHWEPGVLLGRYTATLNLNRSYDDITDKATVSFWVIPWKLVLGLFVALLVLIILIRFVTRRFEVRKRSL